MASGPTRVLSAWRATAVRSARLITATIAAKLSMLIAGNCHSNGSKSLLARASLTRCGLGASLLIRARRGHSSLSLISRCTLLQALRPRASCSRVTFSPMDPSWADAR